MNSELQTLIDSLREELRQYGEMLVLLDDQQNRILRRRAPELLDATTAVNHQGEAIRSARDQRESARRDLARRLDLSGDVPFTRLAPMLPPDYRPLVSALVQENNQLLTRIQQRARQNSLLLRRSLDLLDQVIHSFAPVRTPVYTGAGSLHHAAACGAAMYEAVC
jgi:hypothetical protein